MSNYKINPFNLEIEESAGGGPIICLDATVQNSDLTYSVNVASGGTLVIPDTSIENGDATYYVNVPSTSSVILPDTNIYVNGSIEGSVFSVKNIDINQFDSTGVPYNNPNAPSIAGNTIEITLPDSTIANSNTSYQTSILVGSTLILPDNEFYVNGFFEGSFPGLNFSDINITDGTGPVTPTAITLGPNANEITIEVPAAVSRSTAKLMKTGQTTSYRTGDDGDFEAGRNVSFTVLAENNVYGNTNRFTDELGTQTYTNNIVIDWSTYDGSTVTGWLRTSQPSVIWSTGIDTALALSIGTFTIGWRMANITEMLSICNFSISRFITYSPFNGTNINLSFWTSTTSTGTSSQAYRFDNFGIASSSAKSGTAPYYAVRTFTVTGTTLS